VQGTPRLMRIVVRDWMTTPDHIRAHRHTSRHRQEVQASERCGCFYCRAIFAPSAEPTRGDSLRIEIETKGFVRFHERTHRIQGDHRRRWDLG